MGVAKKGLWVLGISVFCATALAEPPDVLSNLAPGDRVSQIYRSSGKRARPGLDHSYRLSLDPAVSLSSPSGTFRVVWRQGRKVAQSTDEFAIGPAFKSSFADGAELVYSPFRNVFVTQRWWVYNSDFLVQEFVVENRANRDRTVQLQSVFESTMPIKKVLVSGADDQIQFQYSDPSRGKKALVQNVVISRPAFSLARAFADVHEFTGPTSPDTEAPGPPPKKKKKKGPPETAGFFTLHEVNLGPGETETIRVTRSIRAGSVALLWSESEQLVAETRFEKLFEENRDWNASIPAVEISERARSIAYSQSWNQLRAFAIEESDETYGSPTSYYLTSQRGPGGWPGPSFPSSLSLIALAKMDSEFAWEALLLWADMQDNRGFIPATMPTASNPQRSSTPLWPLLAWVGMRLHGLSPDLDGLEEIYYSAADLARFYQQDMDLDKDGLVDKRSTPEGKPGQKGKKKSEPVVLAPSLELNLLLVGELQSLSEVARLLGLAGEASEWDAAAGDLRARILKTFWKVQERRFARPAMDTATTQGVETRPWLQLLPLWAQIADTDQVSAVQARFDESALAKSLGADYASGTGLTLGHAYLVFRGLVSNGLVSEARAFVDELWQATNPVDPQSIEAAAALGSPVDGPELALLGLMEWEVQQASQESLRVAR